jgi:hypothetical protein
VLFGIDMKLTRRHRTTSVLLVIMASALSIPFRGTAGASPPRAQQNFEQFAYSSNNGSPPDVGAIAQARNGDLWLASQTGLLSSTACISAVFSLLALGICAAI